MDSWKQAHRKGVPCCDTPLPTSVGSTGLTSMGHPQAGRGSNTDPSPLRHRRLRVTGPWPHAPRRTADRLTQLGLGAVSRPRGIGAGRRTSTSR